METLKNLTYSFSLDLHSMEMSASTAKDQFPFVAIITFGGRPSDGLVGGTEQVPGGPYKVLIPTTVLQDKIEELVGTPVFAADSLDSHSNSIEVGEFMQAWVEPVQDSKTGEFISVAKASGMLFRDRDPDLVDRIISGARNGIMGFSWDIGEVKFNLVELSASEKVIKIVDLEWRGATVLKKEAAAYQLTQLAASGNHDNKEKNSMDKDVITAIKETIAEEFKGLKAASVTKDDLEEIKTGVDEIKTKVDGIEEKQTALEKDFKASKNGGDPPKGEGEGGDPPKEKEDEPEGDTISLKDFAGIMKGAMEEANKPVLEALKGLTAKAPDEDSTSNGRRKSISGGEIEHIYAKYVDKDELEDEDEPHKTERGIEIAIAAVKDKVKNRRQRDELLAPLSAERRRLVKVRIRREGLGLED